MEDLYEKTKERTEQIKNAGYNLVEMWECEWKKSPLFKKFKNSLDFVEPLNPREAYFGGRTEAFKLKAKSGSNKKIKYIDVCSLYPTVMYYDKYPIEPNKNFPSLYVRQKLVRSN